MNKILLSVVFSIFLLFSCSQNTPEPVSVNPVKKTEKGARPAGTATWSADMLGQWKLTYGYTGTGGTIWNFESTHGCDLSDTWLFVGQYYTGQDNGFFTITNRKSPCGSASLSNLINPPSLTGPHERFHSVGWSTFSGEVANWNEVTYPYSFNLQTSRGDGYLSIPTPYQVTFSPSKTTMYWDYEDSPYVFHFIWQRAEGGPAVP